MDATSFINRRDLDRYRQRAGRKASRLFFMRKEIARAFPFFMVIGTYDVI